VSDLQQPPTNWQQQQAPQPGKRKRKIRVFTWIILAINVLFLIWIIAGVSSVSSSACDPSLSQETCTATKEIGGGIGVLLIIFLWVAVDVILGIIWLVTRKKEPTVVYIQQPPATN
jgi:hypothetical protein